MMVRDYQHEIPVNPVCPEFCNVMVVACIKKMHSPERMSGYPGLYCLCSVLVAITIRAGNIGTIYYYVVVTKIKRLVSVNPRKVHNYDRNVHNF